jgi:hypothetical protein
MTWRRHKFGDMLTDKPIDAGAPEDEITSAMVEAGAEVIWLCFSDVLARGSETGREMAIEVYRAMRSRKTA